MYIGIINFPGSHCLEDLIYSLSFFPYVKYKIVWYEEKKIENFDWIIIPGGFSFGDYLRPGALASFTPIMRKIKQYVKDGGKVLGICNGFQILIESGLLPGALIKNKNLKFISKFVYLKVVNHNTYLTKLVKKNTIYLPIAHHSGRYYISEKELKNLYSNNQIIFQYCTENGIVDKSVNENGSLENIAGISNESFNVFGIMPHPERAIENILGSQDGLLVFESMFRI